MFNIQESHVSKLIKEHSFVILKEIIRNEV